MFSLFSLESWVVLGIETLTSCYLTQLRQQTEDVALALRPSLRVDASLVLSDDVLQEGFLRHMAKQSATRRTLSDFGPVALTSASAVNSLIQLAKLESIDLSEMSCETSEQLRGIASAAFFIGILLWQGSQGDIGMWWRLNFIRHVAMTSLMLVFSYQGTGNPCSLVYNQDTAMWLKMLKVCSAAFALNAWMEVGGRLLLPSWFCVNLAMFADTFWIHTPGPNDMMERVIPHMVGSTAAILWISARQASAMQSFLKMQLR